MKKRPATKDGADFFDELGKVLKKSCAEAFGATSDRIVRMRDESKGEIERLIQAEREKSELQLEAAELKTQAAVAAVESGARAARDECRVAQERADRVFQENAALTRVIGRLEKENEELKERNQELLAKLNGK